MRAIPLLHMRVALTAATRALVVLLQQIKVRWLERRVDAPCRHPGAQLKLRARVPICDLLLSNRRISPFLKPRVVRTVSVGRPFGLGRGAPGGGFPPLTLDGLEPGRGRLLSTLGPFPVLLLLSRAPRNLDPLHQLVALHPQRAPLGFAEPPNPALDNPEQPRLLTTLPPQQMSPQGRQQLAPASHSGENARLAPVLHPLQLVLPPQRLSPKQPLEVGLIKP